MSLFKASFLFFALLGFGLSQGQDLNLSVPANQSVEVDYPDLEDYDARIANRSRENLTVRVVSKETGEQVRGFGLGPRGRATVKVEASNQLILVNEGDAAAGLRLNLTENTPAPPANEDTYINFTLQNKSAQSIPLIIPTVMNPNLSPFSNSGVSLKIGQEIFFKEGNRRYVLLVVDESIKPGDEINVAELLRDRKRELGL